MSVLKPGHLLPCAIRFDLKQGKPSSEKNKVQVEKHCYPPFHNPNLGKWVLCASSDNKVQVESTVLSSFFTI